MRSPHPTDVLIREILRLGRTPSAREIDQIILRMASAPFPSDQVHLERHTADEQWADGTTLEEYTGDLRRAIGDETARSVIYVRRGGNMAVVLTDTEGIFLMDGAVRRRCRYCSWCIPLIAG
ncbi:MAG: hypothetical protein ACR2JY_15675 [Chloroflexota bacterium]